MNQNYVRKCEEYLQNIPSQKLAPPPSSLAGSNLSSRKLTQKPGPPAGSLRQGRQSINNPPPPPPVPPPPAEGSRPKPKPPTMMTGRRTPFRSPTVGSGSAGQQQGSKFSRPCCRPNGGVGRRGSDNVNQNVDVRVMDGTDGRGGGEGTTTTERKTKTWGRILGEVATETVEVPLTKIISKAHSPPPPEPAPITSTIPKGAVQHQHPLVPNPSVTSLSTTVTSSSVAVRPASSSIAAVPPQPRALPSTTTTATEHVHRKPSSTSTTEAPENQLQLQGINLFRFDPLRTLQFLTLELKSKLKPLLTTTTVADDGTSVHKQLYKISKELLYAVKILTENASQQKPAAAKTTCNCSCQPRDKVTSIGKISSKPAICGDLEASLECQNCLELQNALDRLRAEQSCLPRKEINYLQDPRPTEDSSKASTATDQLQLRLEGEIKRLQTMISDKQTTPTATEGLISDLNRKLDETTHARDEAQRKLLYATLENERLNFLLRSQCSTMTNLQNDFSAIQSLADQQIDLLDQTHNNVDDGGLNNRSRSKSNTVALAFGGNHHRNYRYPSGSGGGPNLATASPVEQVVKLRHRHYSFQNIAEKESDDGGNDANDCHWRNSSQRQPLRQEPEVMLRLPSSTLLVGQRDAFQQQEKPELKKNRATGEEAESGTSEPSGSLSEVNSLRSERFGPAKRALLIDSDRDNSLEKDLEESQQQQQSSSSSSLSSLTSSQQQQQQQIQQRYRGHERKEPRTTIGDNRRESAASTLGDKPLSTSNTGDDTENFSGYTNNDANNNHHIQSSKTNDCVSLASGIDGMAPNRQQLGPGGSKKDTLPVLTTTTTAAKGKYPRDYGDKFERRESLLAVAGTGPGPLEEKELCQNRPIMGQIRSGSEGEGRKGEALVGKIISDDANEPASGQTRTTTATATEEFSIDFDDITLPSSPIPFRARRDGPAAGEEFPSSFGDWM